MFLVDFFLEQCMGTHQLLPVFLLNMLSDLAPVGLDVTLLYKLCYRKPSWNPSAF